MSSSSSSSDEQENNYGRGKGSGSDFGTNTTAASVAEYDFDRNTKEEEEEAPAPIKKTSTRTKKSKKTKGSSSTHKSTSKSTSTSTGTTSNNNNIPGGSSSGGGRWDTSIGGTKTTSNSNQGGAGAGEGSSIPKTSTSKRRTKKDSSSKKNNKSNKNSSNRSGEGDTTSINSSSHRSRNSKKSNRQRQPQPITAITQHSQQYDYSNSNNSTSSSNFENDYYDGNDDNNNDFDTIIQPCQNSDVKHSMIGQTKFDTMYQRGRKLGLGAFAIVFIGTHRPTETEYAVKQIDRSTMFWGDRDALQDEISNLKLARSGPNIVQLYEVYEEKAFCYLIMEVMEGGELLECILEKKGLQTFTETEARSAIRCVLRALAFLHDNRIAHRDLKPENVLLSDPYHKDLNSVKLADFSFAKKVMKKNDCRTLCGTPGYLSPEMLERFPAYDVKCDVWSVGCLLFLLLSGYLPFDSNNNDCDDNDNCDGIAGIDHDDYELIFDLTREGRFEFIPKFWNNVSKSAKELVTKMLTVSPKKRISASKALQSFWIEKGDTALEERQLNIKKLQNLVEGKRKFNKAISTLLKVNRIKELNDDFKEYLGKRKEENVINRLTANATGGSGGGGGGSGGGGTYNEDSLTGKPFGDFYEIGDELGEGGYAFVYRCEHLQTKKIYAVKEVIISKMESGGESTLKDEIAALKLLRGGAHIIRLFDVFYEGDHCFMVMEEMRGGDLLSRICDKEVYTEREARGVCKSIFEAILYCHQKNVAHRDIKPENLLMVEADDDTSIKLADFGFAKRVTGELSLNTLCGTAQYVAPEILDFNIKGYDERCDMWSVGVVTYILLGGYAPFEGEPDELAQFIISGDYEFHDKYWGDISESAKDMIHNMLQTDPQVRLTAIEALRCEWMGLAPEQLASKDLGGAQHQMEEQQHRLEENAANAAAAATDAVDGSGSGNDTPGNKKNKMAGKKALQALITTNKFLSLGAMVGGATTKDPNKLGVEKAAEYDFEDTYNWGRQIGVGSFSVIHEAVHEDDDYLYAVKRIPRVDLWEEDAMALQSEIMCLQEVSECDCIVYLKEVFDETDFTYMVMELLPGGYLIDKIIEKHFYEESKGMIVAKRLITAVEFCHYHRIAIRDLKPENMLLVEGSDTEVKLSDFGHATIVLQPNSLTTVCGTEGFVAPEIIEHHPQYDVECDMWSLGVVLYVLLGGYRPFRGEGEDCLEKIRYGEYKFHRKYWSHVSDDVKHLISRMLTVDPSRRITAPEALDCDLIVSTPDKEGRGKRNKKKSSSEGKKYKSTPLADKWN